MPSFLKINNYKVHKVILLLGRGQCELLCKAEGFGFFDMLADQVIDGTPCTNDNNLICIQGKCLVSFIFANDF